MAPPRGRKRRACIRLGPGRASRNMAFRRCSNPCSSQRSRRGRSVADGRPASPHRRYSIAEPATMQGTCGGHSRKTARCSRRYRSSAARQLPRRSPAKLRAELPLRAGRLDHVGAARGASTDEESLVPSAVFQVSRVLSQQCVEGHKPPSPRSVTISATAS